MKRMITIRSARRGGHLALALAMAVSLSGCAAPFGTNGDIDQTTQESEAAGTADTEDGPADGIVVGEPGVAGAEDTEAGEGETGEKESGEGEIGEIDEIGAETTSHSESPANTPGNIYGNGIAVGDEKGFYFYDAEEGAVYLTQDGETTLWYSGALMEMNLTEEMLYGVKTSEDGTQSIVALSRTSKTEKQLRDTGALYLTYYDGFLYFCTPNTAQIVKLDPQTGEEEILSKKPSYYIFFRDGFMYYQDDNSGESLWKMDLESGETAQLNEERTYYPQFWQDRIIYLTYDHKEQLMICSIALDGTDRAVLVASNVLAQMPSGKPVSMNISGDGLYFLGENDSTVLLCRMDLTQKEITYESIDVLSPFYDKFDAFHPSIKNYTVDNMGSLSIVDGYAAFLFHLTEDEGDTYVTTFVKLQDDGLTIGMDRTAK